MARPEVPPARDDLDALFEADAGIDDLFASVRDNQEADKENNRRNNEDDIRLPTKKRKEADSADEEIKITKKRKPIAKLDETRLLSENGIPRLQKLAKTQWKFKGKGHEFSDAGRLLYYYQRWLDDLYPRAKFADGLVMVEKVGHSKRMQMQRKAWIETGKPKSGVEDGEDVEPGDEDEDETREEGKDGDVEHGGDIFDGGANSDGQEHVDPFDLDLGLDLDKSKQNDSNASREKEQQETAGPDEDDLDALLAMEESSSHQPNNPAQDRPPSPKQPSFDDDEEAMRELEDMW